MKFSDNVIREDFDKVYVKRDEKTFGSSSVAQSNDYDVANYNSSYNPVTQSPINLYQINARDVKIGESIYDEDGEFEAYRSN